MMRSLFSGISGLRNHQTRMDVIGNNIANVNTVGFKAGRVNFQDILSQTLQGASGSTSGGRGGTNPIQVGLGMGLASIDTIFTDGSFQPTGKQTDLSIQGQGFFNLTDGTNTYFTRAGGFDFDNDGNLLVPGTGYKVMGWLANSGGVVDTTQPISGIQVPVGSSMPAKVTSTVGYTNNLSSEAAVGTTNTVTITTFDSQGNAHKLTGTFAKTASNTWTFTPAATTDTAATVATNTTNPFTVTFDANGQYVTTANAATITVTPTGSYAGAGAFTLTPDFSALTQYGGSSTVQATSQNGYASGTLERLTIDTTGVIVGRFSNGQTQNLAQIALTTFNNPSGLTKIGESLFAESPNSGTAQTGAANTGGRGKISPGSLEMSNVDLAQEFSNMIITQRGFQSNSKIITATDEMLQELTNLKR